MLQRRTHRRHLAEQQRNNKHPLRPINKTTKQKRVNKKVQLRREWL